MEVVLGNDYNFYADGEIVDAGPPLLDGSIGAEDSRIVATMEHVAERGTVSFAGPAQVLGLEYKPPAATYAPVGVARADFRYVPIDPDGVNEGAPVLYVDVAPNREALAYSAGYGFAIFTPSINGPAEIAFVNSAFNAEADMAISDSQISNRVGILNDLDWYTAQIEWSLTDVFFSILSGSETVLAWSSPINSTRAPLRHLRSGGFHAGSDGLLGNPVFTQVDNAYLAVDTIPPEAPVAEPTVTRQWPRDDALGSMGSGTRIYPPPRRGRVYPAQQ